ncbi:MAG: ParB/RepB/Spo0J family partition protein [Clostridiales bacterium]|nr:ParB/RepB/Spo0J family partition protein [Clostridiales bacterium]
MAVNRGLGKGLSALFSNTEAEYGDIEVGSRAPAQAPLKIPVRDIYANPSQPRKSFDREALSELAHSIREHGIISPLVVCPRGGKYMIVAGERRFRAALEAGLEEVPAIVRELSDRQVREVALIENLQREDLNPVDAAEGLRQLIDEYGMTQEEVAQRLGKSRPWVANLLRLLSLPQPILDMVRGKRLSEGHARALVGLDHPEAMGFAQKAAEQNLSVREMEKLARESRVPSRPRQRQSEVPHSMELKDLISDMQRVFGTKVSAVGTNSKGRIYIDYFSPDDLDRIFHLVQKLKRM